MTRLEQITFNTTLTVEQYHLLQEALTAKIMSIKNESEAIESNAAKDDIGLYPELNDSEQYQCEKLNKQEWEVRAITTDLENQWSAQQYGDNQ